MPEYTVNWTGTYESDTPMQAAVEAWEAMQRVGSIANVFDVSDESGMTARVDIDDMTIGPAKWVPSREQLALFAAWMADEQWDISEIVEMVRRPSKYANEYSSMLFERAYDAVAKEPELDDTED